MAESPKPWMTREQFTAAMRLAGIALTAEQMDELYRASNPIGKLVKRVHAFEVDPVDTAPTTANKRPPAP